MVLSFDEIISYALYMFTPLSSILMVSFWLFLAILLLKSIRRHFGTSTPLSSHGLNEGDIPYTVARPYGGSRVCKYCGSLPGYGFTCRGCGAPNVYADD
jgi:hypothetical protein